MNHLLEIDSLSKQILIKCNGNPLAKNVVYGLLTHSKKTGPTQMPKEIDTEMIALMEKYEKCLHAFIFDKLYPDVAGGIQWL